MVQECLWLLFPCILNRFIALEEHRAILWSQESRAMEVGPQMALVECKKLCMSCFSAQSWISLALSCHYWYLISQILLLLQSSVELWMCYWEEKLDFICIVIAHKCGHDEWWVNLETWFSLGASKVLVLIWNLCKETEPLKSAETENLMRIGWFMRLFELFSCSTVIKPVRTASNAECQHF